MYTKPLVLPTTITLDISSDLSAIRRLLLAAALSPGFCTRLLDDPDQAVRAGFGGEHFSISESTLMVLSQIRVATLTEFINQLDVHLSNRLLTPEYRGVDR